MMLIVDARVVGKEVAGRRSMPGFGNIMEVGIYPATTELRKSIFFCGKVDGLCRAEVPDLSI